jgi:hypothetical protein
MKTNREKLLIEIQRELVNYPFFPNKLVEYIIQAIKSNSDEELLPKILSSNRKYYIESINRMFEDACSACESTIDDLLRNLGFRPQDTVYGSLDAMFAVVRTINGLKIWGFSNIRPLPAGKIKQADIICEKGNYKCAVDVFCSLGKYFRFPDHEQKSNDLRSYYIDKVWEKKIQLETTASTRQCDKKIFSLVLNSLKSQAFLVHKDFELFLESIANDLKLGPDYHYILITGMRDEFTGEIDDVLYPFI